MQYRVLWTPYAEDKLELLLQAASAPAVLATAARQIDRHLMTAPSAFGESRYDTIRIGFVYPLGTQFEVMDDVRTVVVHDVWRIDRKKGEGTT
jgi:hypothetical protein